MTNPVPLHVQRVIKREIEKEQARKEQEARDMAKAIYKEQEKAVLATAIAEMRETSTRPKSTQPKSKKAYGSKHYTNSKGYPRKPQSYGS